MKHTFKRVMALLLVVAMLLGVMPSVFGAQVGSFTDVQDDAWYAEFVKAVTEAGYMSGVRKDLFDPEGTCTRAMAATVLYRVEGEPPVGGPSTFKDLTADWYANAIAWAQDTGVVYGVTQTTFCPDKSVTREQLVTMIWRYMGEPEAKGTLDTFEDREYVAEYAREAFAWAIGEGIINGMPKGEGFILSPYTNATRAQFATIIVSAFKPHEHQWDEGTVTKEPNCGTAGEKTFTCTLCDQTKTEAIAPAGEHSWNEGEITLNPTCKDEGVKTFTCNKCGEKKTEAIAPTGQHIIVNGKCTVCGMPVDEKYVLTTELKDGQQVVIVCAAKNIALGADYGTSFYNPGVAVEPVDGVITTNDATIVWTVGKEGDFYTFSYNGQKIGMGTEYTSMTLGAVNYKWIVEAAANEGTFYVINPDRDPAKSYYMQWYEAKNYWSGYHTLNDELMALRFYAKDGTPVPPCEHVWNEGEVTTAATCDKDGVKTYTCTKCSATKTEAIPALGHNYQDGSCTNCGKPDPNAGQGIKYVAVSQLNEGDEVIIVCDSRNIALGADYGTSFYNPGVAVEPVDGVITTNDATIVWTVGKEGDFYTFSYNGQKIGMGTEYTSMTMGAVNYKWIVEAAANEGTFYVINPDRDPAKSYYMQWYEAKNYWSGYHTLNDELMALRFYAKDGTPVPPCEHVWNEGEVTTAATCDKDGVKTYTCTKCSATKTEAIPALGHNYQDGSCTNCGKPDPNAGQGIKYVAVSQLNEGDEVIIVCDSRNIALGTDYGTSFYNPGVAVEPVDGVITTNDATIVWTVGKEGDFYTFSYNGQKIGMGTEYTSMTLGAVNYKWIVEAAANEGTFYVINPDRDPAKSYYMQWYEAKNYWSGYHTLNDELMALRFYVKGGQTEEPKEDFTILFTNDVHTYVDNEGLRYSNVAGLKSSIEAEGTDVILVDAGDHVQGTAFGGYDNGESIIRIMNAAGYDLATLGNHEFDYGMAQALKNVDLADFPYVSANFYHEAKGVRGENVLDSFKMFTLGGSKVAIIGVTTPETFTKTTPAYFMDENGNYIYGIAGGKDGAALYADVQKAIDMAKAAGAEYVIALGHLGDDPASMPWTSEEVIANTTGLDVVIDGHSHSTVVGAEVMDKNGNPVVLAQTGDYLSNIGKMTITAEGDIIVELITEVEDIDDGVKDLEDELITAVDEWLGTVVAQNEVDFRISDDAGTRLIRKQETNLGDFCADALYYLFDVTENLGCDVAIMNGGGIRANMPVGEVSYKTTKTVHTFGNVACLIEVTGQQILDALEWGAKNAGVGENGGFLHVSGLSYQINTAIPSTVQMDEKGVWIGGPTGAYRVSDVYVAGRALDLTKTYKLAGYNYTLRDLGDGFAMFAGATNIKDYVMQDYLVLANYAAAFPGAVIGGGNSPLGAEYDDINGEGRISIVNEAPTCEHKWDQGKVTAEATCIKDGVMTYTCTLCNETKTEAIKATGEHNYVDGFCTDCGEEDPTGCVVPGELADGEYVVVAYINGTYYAMSNTFAGKINGAAITVTNGKVAAADAEGYVITLGTTADGGRTISGANGYLSYVSGTNLGAVADPYAWIVEKGSAEGTWKLTASSADTRGLLFQAGQYNRFGGYALSNIGKAEYAEIMFLPVG